MNDERITAIWEEDGDLMRLKKYFAYVHQDEDLKARIKNKTLEKITDLSDTAHIPSPAVKDKAQTTGINPSQEEPSMDKDKTKLTQIIAKIPVVNSFKNRRTLKILSAAAVLIFAVYLGSTGFLQDGISQFRNLSQGSAPMPAAMPSPSFTSSMDMKSKEIGTDAAYGQDARNSAAVEESAMKTIEQKNIYVLEASLRADNVVATSNLIEEKVTSMGGYIAESRQNNNDNEITSYLSLRIPNAQFQSFKGELSNYGIIANQHLYTDDVSRQYFDVETRLRSWEAQEKRYFEILQQAKTVEDIIRIEDSLANVRREMESLKGQLKYWDNRVDYSEIRLNISSSQNAFSVNDPWQPVSFTSTILAAKNAVIKSISFIWNSINYFFIFLGYTLPLILVIGIGWFAYRWKRTNKN